MKRLALALALVVTACSPDPERALRRLTVDEVAARLGRVTLLDCNPRDVYDRGHVPGARWVAFDAVAAGDLPVDKDAPLVFYCANEH